MKKLSLIFLVVLLFSCCCIAQPILNGSTNLNVAGNQIVKINTSTYTYGVSAIGRETVDWLPRTTPWRKCLGTEKT